MNAIVLSLYFYFGNKGFEAIVGPVSGFAGCNAG